MTREYVIDFECDVYAGLWSHGKKVMTIIGAALTDISPELSEEICGGMDPHGVIDDAALQYAGVESPCYTVTHLHSWSSGYVNRNSPIWRKCTWSNP